MDYGLLSIVYGKVDFKTFRRIIRRIKKKEKQKKH
jgi:hypothetical protein